MWPRFSFNDFRTIAHYLGVLIVCFAVAPGVPFVTALLLQEWEPASRYLLTVGICLTIGTAMRLLMPTPSRLNRQQAMAVTGLAWIVLALIAAIPLAMSNHYNTYTDALFDCVSGLTTTGATCVTNIDHMSAADNMFRFVMHFVGGMGLVVVALSLGLFGRRSSDASLYASEGRSEHVVPNVVQTTRFIARMAVTVILCALVPIFLVLLVTGMEPLRAFLHGLWLSISAFMTGGFSPMSTSVMYYHSAVVETLLMVVMLLGSINFALYPEIRRGRTDHFFHDLEIRTGAMWLLLMTAVLVATLASAPLFNDLPEMLRNCAFMIVSAASTTGFQTVSANQLTTTFSSGAFLVLAIVMAVGGGAGATSGGIKFHRVGIIWKSFVSTVKSALFPASARVVVDYHHIGRRQLRPEVSREALTVFTLYVITYVIGTLAGLAYGYDAMTALFESVAMASNGGISAGISGAGMPLGLEIIYILQMWAGRLEFVTLMALIVEIVVSITPDRETFSRLLNRGK